jgi:nanoRNase/pAp phosphatase (c-di-AMP/oligoRNAs hydrolase)
MDDAKKQLVDKLNSSNNILVTVSRNPSVDQLASCIGLTLLLNKQGKHAAAVFSGIVPSTLEFLQPEDTLEKTTDSLRDFIISLDKSKADKLRYKVEDNVVRIFITPYRTSISADDLEFTQGDFNVDVVVALGVQLQEELDEAITAHGRILHDATLASISTSAEAGLGSINWHDPQASSLSELVTDLARALGSKDNSLLDNQIATALLTGIVAETDRFSNDKTNSQTMSASAILMAAGANQQLIATKLEEAAEIPLSVQNQGAMANSSSEASPSSGNGVMQVSHEAPEADQDSSSPTLPDFDTSDMADDLQSSGSPVPPFSAGDSASANPIGLPTPVSGISPGARMVTEPPTLGGVLTANTRQEMLDPATDSLGVPGTQPPQLLDRTADSWLASASPSVPPSTLPGPSTLPPSMSSSTPAAQMQNSPFTTNSAGIPPIATPSPSPIPSLVGFTPPPPLWVPPPTSVPATTPSQVAPVTPIEPNQPIQPAPATPPSQDINSSSDLPNSLADLEAAVQSPHLDPANLDAARDEVNRALNSTPDAETTHPEAIQALNAQPLGSALHDGSSGPAAVVQPTQPAPPQLPQDDFGTNPGPTLDDILGPPAPGPQVVDSTAPPPVPPPIPFQFGSPPQQ